MPTTAFSNAERHYIQYTVSQLQNLVAIKQANPGRDIEAALCFDFSRSPWSKFQSQQAVMEAVIAALVEKKLANFVRGIAICQHRVQVPTNINACCNAKRLMLDSRRGLVLNSDFSLSGMTQLQVISVACLSVQNQAYQRLHQAGAKFYNPTCVVAVHPSPPLPPVTILSDDDPGQVIGTVPGTGRGLSKLTLSKPSI